MSTTSTALERRNVEQQQRQKTLAKRIEQMKPEIARALPRHLNPDRVARIAVTVMRRTPKLALCTEASFLGALMTCAQLGLEPGPLGHAYLVPFTSHRRNCTNRRNCDCPSEVTFIAGYKGLVDLARRSGQVSTVYAKVVREGDRFDYEFGLNPKLEHKPAADVDKPLTHTYAVIRYKDGGADFDVLTRAEVERIRSRSRAAKDGPWVTDYEEMAKKTVLRRLCKTAPMSVEYQRAVSNDEQARTSTVLDDIDMSVPLDDPEAIDGEVVEESQPQAESVDWPATAEPGSGESDGAA
jgi:recombination protein RecT